MSMYQIRLKIMYLLFQWNEFGKIAADPLPVNTKEIELHA